MRASPLATAALVALAAACATPAEPGREIAKAELAVRDAETSGAPDSSPADLQLAREKLEHARQAYDAGDYTESRRLAEEAGVDARLAEVKAEAEAARTARIEIERRMQPGER